MASGIDTATALALKVLRASEARYRRLFETARDGILLLNSDTAQIEDVNPYLIEMLGYSHAEFLGKKLWEVGPFSDSAESKDMFKQVQANGYVRYENLPLKTKAGAQVDVEFVSNSYDCDGIKVIQCNIRNITERKEAAKTVRLASARYKALMDAAIDGMHILDCDGNLVEANPAFLRMLGYEKGLPKALHVSDWDPDWKPREDSAGLATVIQGQSRKIERCFRHVNGSKREVEINVNAVEIDGVPYLYCIDRDISERNAATRRIERLTKLYATLSHTNEATLRARTEEGLFAAICHIAAQQGGMFSAAVRMVDEKGETLRLVATSESLRERHARTAVGVKIGLPGADSIPSVAFRENRVCIHNDILVEHPSPEWQQVGQALGVRSVAALPLRRAGKSVGVFVITHCEPDYFDAEIKALLEEMASNISFVLDSLERETKREFAEKALVESEGRFRSLVEQAIAGIYIIDSGRFNYVNSRFAEIFGYTPQEMMAFDTMTHIAEEDRVRVRESVSKRLSGESPTMQFTFTGRRKDGSRITVGIHGSVATIEGRKVIIGLAQDISEKKRAEEEIQRYVEQLKTAFMSTVEVATTLSEMRDPYTAGHERRVAEIAVAIGAELGLDEHRQEGLRVAGHLHDTGKITVPSEILSKPGKLSAIELQLIQGHAQAGYDVLKAVEWPWPVAQIALQHHERIDGTGYPQGLKGEAILLEARIMAVADVIEAMSSHRPYRPGLGIDKALAEIEHGRGTAYDAEVADACLRLFREGRYRLPA